VSTAAPPPDAPTARPDWRGLEEEQDLYSAFLRARTSGKPELIYETAEMLQACVMASFANTVLDIQNRFDVATRSGDQRAYRSAQIARAASERLAARCRAGSVSFASTVDFGVTFWQKLQKEQGRLRNCSPSRISKGELTS
jgi:hypothetical protein